MTIEQVYTLESILDYKLIGPLERATMQNFITEFIDPKAQVCGHCSAQLRFWHSQIQMWADANAEMINQVKNPPKKRGRKPKIEE
jgi:hypothetical protein